jgi:hypothetical protein
MGNLEIKVVIKLEEMVIVPRVVRVEIFEDLDFIQALIEEILQTNR